MGSIPMHFRQLTPASNFHPEIQSADHDKFAVSFLPGGLQGLNPFSQTLNEVMGISLGCAEARMSHQLLD